VSAPEIMRADRWNTNAAMIADAVMPLGYIEGSVLDATYGECGGFWKDYRPEGLVTNDLNADADHHHDFRAFPFPDRAFTTVVYDPPYKLNGRPQDDVMDQRFGTGQYLTIGERLAMIEDGAVECWRITDKWLLVKCMDQVVSGRMCWQTHRITNLLVPLGARLKDRFDFLTTPRKQPEDRGQKHARSNYSTLLVFVRESLAARPQEGEQ
jgi:hypothetical protein